MQKKTIYLILLIASMVVNVMLGFIYYSSVTNIAMLQTELAKMEEDTSTEVRGDIQEADQEESASVNTYDITPDQVYVFGEDIPIGTYALEFKYLPGQPFVLMKANSVGNCKTGGKGVPDGWHGVTWNSYGPGATIEISGNPEFAKLTHVSDLVDNTETQACDTYYG